MTDKSAAPPHRELRVGQQLRRACGEVRRAHAVCICRFDTRARTHNADATRAMCGAHHQTLETHTWQKPQVTPTR
eukprot:COSAG01_NODE_11222_length_1979_cov_2.502128_3_plen_75_part_00